MAERSEANPFFCWDFPTKKEQRPQGDNPILCWDFPTKKDQRPQGANPIL
jgi:hypothetical protein